MDVRIGGTEEKMVVSLDSQLDMVVRMLVVVVAAVAIAVVVILIVQSLNLSVSPGWHE
jgi:cell division septal protein FtsQ